MSYTCIAYYSLRNDIPPGGEGEEAGEEARPHEEAGTDIPGAHG
jgi:hypothetical protein